jgi:hypothetical protein
MATAKAGRTIPVRWSSPRLRRERRDPPAPVVLPAPLSAELRDPVADLSDPVVAPVDAGLGASSIAVRCRDNAVPSVCVALDPLHLPLPINDARKEVRTSATSERKMPVGLPAFSDANHILITRSVTDAAELRDDQRHE